MAAAQVGDGNTNSDGMKVGVAGGYISFFGETPVVQQTKATAVATTAATSTTNAYGFTTAAQADAIVTAVNAIIVNLTNLGLTD